MEFGGDKEPIDVMVLEFGGSKEPIDVMVHGTFAVDQKLDLVRAVSQDFLPRFAPEG